MVPTVMTERPVSPAAMGSSLEHRRDRVPHDTPSQPSGHTHPTAPVGLIAHKPPFCVDRWMR
jgi:hypothetical protein